MRFLSRVFSKPHTSRPQINDPVLGAIIFNPNERLWQASVSFDGSYIYIGIKGDEAPSQVLLERAREIAEAAPGFRGRLAEFLKSESIAHFSNIPHHEMYQREIAVLELDQLLLLFPDKPNLAFVLLAGGTLGKWSVDMDRDTFLALIGPE
jgi:hypothetical protein